MYDFSRVAGSRSQRKGFVRPRVEPLEGRCLLASGLTAELVADVLPGPVVFADVQSGSVDAEGLILAPAHG